MTAHAAASIARRKRSNIARTAGHITLVTGTILASSIILASLAVWAAAWLNTFPDVSTGNHQPVSFEQLNQASLSSAIKITN